MSGQPVYQPAGQPISPSELPQGRKYIGPYWGIVEATTDPLLLGRCRIRVHTVYGDENQTPCNALPWAAPCFPAFFFNPPQVGDAVWVQFQEGDARYPVYIGWMPTIPDDAQVRQRHPRKIPLQYDGDIEDGHPYDKLSPRMNDTEDRPFAGEEPPGSNIEMYSTPGGIPETFPEVRNGRSWDPNISLS